MNCFLPVIRESPPSIRRTIQGGLIFNIIIMKDKWIDNITQITLILLMLILAFTIAKVIELNNEVVNQKAVIKELQERTLNHEYRLENIMPNDDLP